MIHGFGLSGLASVLVLGLMLQTATPPRTDDPHADPEPTTASGGCEALASYVETLFTTLDEHSTFADFWVTPDFDGIQQMDRADIETIVDDGMALIEDMEMMDVPGPYVTGHDGLALVFDADIDYVAFLGLDASTVPDLDQRERGLALILRGELTVAKACPDELADIGNYVFYDPSDLETVFE